MKSNRFIFPGVKLPIRDEILHHIEEAAGNLFISLKGLNLQSLNISEYSRKYLYDHLVVLENTIQLSTFVLAHALCCHEGPLKNFVLVDYGAGLGILSLMAKQLGIGTVVYNDIYDVSCRDAQVLGTALQLSAEHYVCGDIDDLIGHLEKHQICSNAMVSSDVIEHIYDVESFIRKLREIRGTPLTIVMSSDANGYNPIIRRWRMKQQRQVEFRDRKCGYGHKERDSLQSYYGLRLDILNEKFADVLGPKELKDLAGATRGMIKKDILGTATKYIRDHIMPISPAHPTNTCDPLTGNWCERLMNPFALQRLLAENGFEGKLLMNYYGSSKSIANNAVRYAMNKLINSGAWSIFIASGYTLFGVRRHGGTSPDAPPRTSDQQKNNED